MSNCRSMNLLLLCTVVVVMVVAADDSMQQQCAQASSSLFPCIDYGDGSSKRPSSDCCTTVGDIRSSRPVCLCFVIQQTRNASSGFRTLGLRVDRLLMLPAACSLVNASVSNCPALLNLPRSSPDYSIFTNITQVTNNSSSDVSPSKAFMRQISPRLTFAVALILATFFSCLS
ncbi:non-specific lipid transfer protein GPI-anchored 1-like [Curcuma longa]|uniref:non-specific lipid transfer protein GPI-anchored 1-like n=1 Tax=Curcuma longa TaxID=136217 RepID=UPI003D9F88CE